MQQREAVTIHRILNNLFSSGNLFETKMQSTDQLFLILFCVPTLLDVIKCLWTWNERVHQISLNDNMTNWAPQFTWPFPL